MVENILLADVFAKFAFPFLLVFAIIFAILEKTEILGSGKTQLNAMVSFVIGLIFVGSVFPKQVVSNMVLFLTVALIVVFVGLVLWGFISGGNLKSDFLKNTALKWTFGIVIVIAVIIALLWATGWWETNQIYKTLFQKSWSETFWTNFIFIVVVAGAIALVVKNK